MFSPIKLSSPKSSEGRNLTGTVRFVRDLAADIHTNIQQWNNLHIQGITYLKDITQEKHNKNYSEILEDLYNKLENVCNNLDGIVRNLDQIKHQIIAISALPEITDKLFVSWPITKFCKKQPNYNLLTEYDGEVAEAVHKAYHMEVKSKRKLLENVAHNYTESSKMVCLAAWVYEPFLTENLIILLSSLLIETGYK